MYDPFLSQTWADRHGAVSGFFADLLRDTWIAFERLTARAYDAPWTKADRQGRRPATANPDRRR